jgi:hypothetical protein
MANLKPLFRPGFSHLRWSELLKTGYLLASFCKNIYGFVAQHLVELTVAGHERMIRRISQRNAYATQMVCGEPAFKAPVPRIGETEHSETELWTIARA